MLSNLVVSLIRTWTPLLVGYLLTVLAETLHVVIDPSSEPGLVALCVAVLSAAYYALVRLLERWKPSLGVLLGVPAKPIYHKPSAAAAELVAKYGMPDLSAGRNVGVFVSEGNRLGTNPPISEVKPPEDPEPPAPSV